MEKINYGLFTICSRNHLDHMSITLIAGAIFLFAFLKASFDREMILADADDE